MGNRRLLDCQLLEWGKTLISNLFARTSQQHVWYIVWERCDADLPTLPDADEDLRVHVEEGDEGEDAGGEGGMPGHGQRVPEDERRVHPATIG